MSKKKDLGISDIMSIVNLLPQEGRFEDLIIADDIKKKCQITQKEIKDFEIKSVVRDNQVMMQWNDDTKKWSYSFTDAENGIISKLLKKASDEEKLGAHHLDLYKMFVK